VTYGRSLLSGRKLVVTHERGLAFMCFCTNNAFVRNTKGFVPFMGLSSHSFPFLLRMGEPRQDSNFHVGIPSWPSHAPITDSDLMFSLIFYVNHTFFLNPKTLVPALMKPGVLAGWAAFCSYDLLPVNPLCLLNARWLGSAPASSRSDDFCLVCVCVCFLEEWE
jgi:hypothetical protein